MSASPSDILSLSLADPGLLLLAPWRAERLSAWSWQEQVTCLPSRASEHNDARGQTLKGGLRSANRDRLGWVAAVRRGAAQVLKHLPVEHGGLGFPGNLAWVRGQQAARAGPIPHQANAEVEGGKTGGVGEGRGRTRTQKWTFYKDKQKNGIEKTHKEKTEDD